MTDITLTETNTPVHLDVEEYIRNSKNGQMTFTIRLNNGTVVDFNKIDYIDVKTKYFGVKPYAEFRVGIKRVTQK